MLYLYGGGGQAKRLALHKGFTLAEVLITLGIIGIVAALMLPALVQNYRKHVVETRLQKFYSAMNQAIKLSEVDNGDKASWDYTDFNDEKAYDWFNNYLAKYVKTTIVKNAGGAAEVYFTDGSMMLMGARAIHFFPQASDYLKVQMGIESLTDTYGEKNFIFFLNPVQKSIPYHYNLGIEPYKYGWDGNITSLYTNDEFGCKKISPSNGHAYCTAIIQMNGWKVPNDYPLKF